MMDNPFYTPILSEEQREKVGNAMIYLCRNMNFVSKTSMLKLLYILDEWSVKESGIPMFNLNYKVWRLGPVNKDIFTDLSGQEPHIFRKYIALNNKENQTFIEAITDFSDDEFTDQEISVLEKVVSHFKNSYSDTLVEYTHRPNSLWNKKVKERGLEVLFELEITNTSDFDIEFEDLIKSDPNKLDRFKDYQEIFGASRG